MVTQAVPVPADDAHAVGAYCLIEGEIAAMSANTQPIRFTAALPSRWNNKLAHYPSRGFGGAAVAPDSPELLSLTGGAGLIARGYVAYGSDNGHSSDNPLDASFALNAAELRNFAGEQLKKVHDAIVNLATAYYGQAPAHSYFIGGSEGGREALTVVQHYPQDYDGVVALFPGHAFTAGLLKFQVIRRAMQLNAGAGRISEAQADSLRAAELAACDELDGLNDSIIGNPNACRLNFSTLRCADAKTAQSNCFSDAQLATLRDMYSPTPAPYSFVDGGTSLPAYTIGADWSTPPSPVADPPHPRPNNQQVADVFVRFFVMRDPDADTLAFDPTHPGKYLHRIHELSLLMDRTDTNLDKFIARGGKLIVIHGLADQGVAPNSTIDYYNKLLKRYGRTRLNQVLRLYMVPGYGHGGGVSFNANGAPSLDALEDWVERGISPGDLVATNANHETPRRTRPLCVYPGWPKYRGEGDPNIANSFSCAVN